MNTRAGLSGGTSPSAGLATHPRQPPTPPQGILAPVAGHSCPFAAKSLPRPWGDSDDPDSLPLPWGDIDGLTRWNAAWCRRFCSKDTGGVFVLPRGIAGSPRQSHRSLSGP